MSKLFFLFVFLLTIKNIFTQYIISLSPYHYKSKKIFNEYLQILKSDADENLNLKIIDKNNISLNFYSLLPNKNIKPYIDYDKKNCLIFAPFAVTFQFYFELEKNVTESPIEGDMYYNLYYIYLNQSVKDFNPIFNLILKEKTSKNDSNYKIILYNGDSNIKDIILEILNKHFFLKYRELFEKTIIDIFKNKINKEYNDSIHIKLSEFFFPNKSYKIGLKFVKFPEMNNKESIMTFFSGNLDDSNIEYVTNNMSEEFKKFNEFQQTKKKFFIDYSLIQKIISNYSEYEFEIVNDKLMFSLQDNFFDVKNWLDLINNTSSVNKILLFFKIKNLTLNNETNLETNFEMIIKNDEQKILNNFPIQVFFNMKAELKNTCSINICASGYEIINKSQADETLKLAIEKMEIILQKSYHNICLFEEGINFEKEFIYIDEYYFDKTGIYLTGEDKRD